MKYRIAGGTVVVVGAVLGTLAVSTFDKQADLSNAMREFQLEDCISSVGGRADVVERDGDLGYFANAAAKVRRAEGQDDLAEKYEHVARKADARAKRARERASLGLPEKVALPLPPKERCLKARPELRE